MKCILSVLLFAAAVLTGAAETMYLNPSAECGAFMTVYGGWPCARSSAVFRYDAQNLYVDAVFPFAEDRNGKTIQPVSAWQGEDSPAVFGGDVMELQLAPPGQYGVYYHFAFGPSGASYTAKKRDMAWNPAGLIAKVKKHWNSWSVSLVIPFAALGEKTPSPGDVWRGNVGRTALLAAGVRECSSWAGATDFHKIEEYGKIVFGQPEPAPNLLLKHAKITPEKYEFEFTGKNLPDKVEAEVVGAGAAHAGGVRKKDIITVQGTFRNDYLPVKCTEQLAVTLKDGNGNVLFSRNGVMPEFQTDILFLNTFYCLAGQHALAFRHGFPGKADLRIEKDGQVVYEQKNVKQEGVVSLKDTRQFPPGRYVVRIVQKNKQTSRVFFILEKSPEYAVAPPDSALKTDGNIIRRNGCPVFLLGISDTPKAFLTFDGAFNLGYGKQGRQLNAVVYEGISTGGRHIRNGTVGGYVYPAWEKHAAHLKKYIQGKDEKNSIRRIMYEAEMPELVQTANGGYEARDSAPVMKKMYQVLKQEKPDQLFSIQVPLPRVTDYADACDILEVVSWRSSYNTRMMGKLACDLASLRKTVGTKPVIFWLGGTIPNNQCRIAEEIRCALYLAVIHDLSGAIIHMGHGFLPAERSRLWSLLSGVNAEIQNFYPAFREGRAADSFLNAVSSPDILCSVRETSFGWTAVAVNTAPVEKTVVFSLSDHAGKAAFPLEHRTVELKNNTLTETFTPYEPKVIVFRRP